MLHFLVSRMLGAVPAMIGVACVVFLLIHLVPGDPVDVLLGESAQAADREALRQTLGLDQPVHLQLLHYLQALGQLDLGVSIHSRRPVLELLLERMPATLELAAAALAVAVAAAVPLGVVAALRRDTWRDHAAMGYSLLGAALPNFWLGPLLALLFSVWLGWFPVSGREGVQSLVLPALTLGTGMTAILARMIRGVLLETLGEDYIRTARAKGLPEHTVVLRHGLRNALLPVVTLLGLQLGALLSGAVITETIFSWPGIGLLTLEAIQRRDYPVVQGCVLLIGLTYILVNTATDLFYAWLDPRVRLGET